RGRLRAGADARLHLRGQQSRREGDAQRSEEHAARLPRGDAQRGRRRARIESGRRRVLFAVSPRAPRSWRYFKKTVDRLSKKVSEEASSGAGSLRQARRTAGVARAEETVLHGQHSVTIR